MHHSCRRPEDQKAYRNVESKAIKEVSDGNEDSNGNYSKGSALRSGKELAYILFMPRDLV